MVPSIPSSRVTVDTSIIDNNMVDQQGHRRRRLPLKSHAPTHAFYDHDVGQCRVSGGGSDWIINDFQSKRGEAGEAIMKLQAIKSVLRASQQSFDSSLGKGSKLSSAAFRSEATLIP